ncbi:MAG: N-acetylmuramoyl-L-alanine amidase [Lachnospiraceae bacterium]|nr:N-acetylmuramoyl-L-alanine amidase [Lachnospiraceae bacterium]
MKKTIRNTLFLLIIAGLLSFLALPEKASAISLSFKYKDITNDKTVTYNGVSPLYYINGSLYNNGTQNAIITDGYAMAPICVFTEGCGAEYSYKSSKKRITLTYKGNTLILYAGSTKASYNGESVTAPISSVRIKYSDTGETTCLVPSRFVAETFGMDYTWTQSTGSVALFTPIELEMDGEQFLYAGTYGKLNYNNTAVDNDTTPSYIVNDNALICLKTISKAIDGFRYDYSSKKKTLSLTYGEITIDMKLGSTDCYANGLLTICPEAPHYITNPETGKGHVYFPGRFVFETFGFDYSWDSATSWIAENETTGIYDPDFDFMLVYDPDSDTADDTQAGEEHDPSSSASVPSGRRSSFYQMLRFPILEGVRTDLIGIHDDLWNDLVYFDLPGNYIQFYQDNPIVNTGEAVKQVQILYYEDADITRIKMYTRSDDSHVILSHKDLMTDKSMVFLFDKPSCLFDKIIVLDAGHGGEDPGTQHGGYNEKDLNFMIVYTYCRQLFDQSDIKVFYSRYTDYLVPLHDRPTLPARVEADFFVSVHHNSVYSTLKNGTEVYYSVKNTGNFNGMNSAAMASMFLGNLVTTLKTERNGTFGARNYVVVSEENDVPAVLLEIGYMSNPAELKRLVKASFQKKVAKIIFKTVKQIYATYGD